MNFGKPDQVVLELLRSGKDWRIAMDATLASLETKASQVKAESKAKADQMLADMKKRRDEFQAKAKAQVQAGEAAMQASNDVRRALHMVSQIAGRGDRPGGQGTSMKPPVVEAAKLALSGAQ
jgi:hypothetical protein